MIIFIAGIHGSGKGTFCKELSSRTGLNHYSSSDVLKWHEVSPDIKNKYVQDIPDTQKRLIAGLERIKHTNSNFILDGHFCLFNAQGESEKIEQTIFELIKPTLIICVTAEIENVVKRLKIRDKKDYSILELQEMQNLELTYSKEVADYLDIKHFECNEINSSAIINTIIQLL